MMIGQKQGKFLGNSPKVKNIKRVLHFKSRLIKRLWLILFILSYIKILVSKGIFNQIYVKVSLALIDMGSYLKDEILILTIVTPKKDV